MSEKRFTLVGGKDKSNEILVKVYDNFEEEVIEKQKVVELLNEQQSTIEKLEWIVDVKQKYIEKLEKRLEE